MKKIIFALVVVVLSSASVFAQVAETPRFACSLNKSEELWIVERESGDSSTSVVLKTKFWNQDEIREVAVLPNPTIVRYGNVYIVLQNNDQSGYAFLRVEKEEKDGAVTYKGQWDVNLFSNDDALDSIQTSGKLRISSCWVLE